MSISRKTVDKSLLSLKRLATTAAQKEAVLDVVCNDQNIDQNVVAGKGPGSIWAKEEEERRELADESGLPSPNDMSSEEVLEDLGFSVSDSGEKRARNTSASNESPQKRPFIDMTVDRNQVIVCGDRVVFEEDIPEEHREVGVEYNNWDPFEISVLSDHETLFDVLKIPVSTDNVETVFKVARKVLQLQKDEEINICHTLTSRDVILASESEDDVEILFRHFSLHSESCEFRSLFKKFAGRLWEEVDTKHSEMFLLAKQGLLNYETGYF